MYRIAFIVSLFASLFSAQVFAAKKQCSSIQSKEALTFTEIILLSKMEQELLSAKTKEERSALLQEFVSRHMADITTERDQLNKQFNVSAKPIGKAVMNQLKRVAKARDKGTLSDAQVLKLESLLLEDEVTKHWSHYSLENLVNYVSIHLQYPLAVEDAVLISRHISGDPNLNQYQAFSAHAIYDRLIELKVWSSAKPCSNFFKRLVILLLSRNTNG